MKLAVRDRLTALVDSALAAAAHLLHALIVVDAVLFVLWLLSPAWRLLECIRQGG